MGYFQCYENYFHAHFHVCSCSFKLPANNSYKCNMTTTWKQPSRGMRAQQNLIFVSYDNKKNQFFFANTDFDVELKM